jgi:hypothetical protein
MIRPTRILFSLLLAMALGACAPATSMIVTVPPENMEAVSQASPTTGNETESPIPTTETIVPVLPSETAVPIPPTDTPLPPLELPSPEPAALPMETWDGLPTYLADSAPNIYFRVNYNPHLWAKTEDQFGQVVLAHRNIPYCVITPIAGRGLPSQLNTQRETRKLGAVDYEVNLAYQGDTLQFAAYYVGTPGELYTGFQVSFQEQTEVCIQDAEAVLASLRSMPQDQATPGL